MGVLIREPSTSNRCQADTEKIALIGSASGDVEQVTWAIDGGASGLADGTAEWSAEVELQEGLNLLSVEASSASGDLATAGLRVLWQPDVRFDGQPRLGAFLAQPGQELSFELGVQADGAISGAAGHLSCAIAGESGFVLSEAGQDGEYVLFQGTLQAPSEADECDAWMELEVDGAARQSLASALWIREQPSEERIDELADLQLDLAALAGETAGDWDATWTAVLPELLARSDLDRVWYTGEGIFWLTDEGLWYALGGFPSYHEDYYTGKEETPAPAPPAPPPPSSCGGEGGDDIPKALYLYTTDPEFPHFKDPYPPDELQSWAEQSGCVDSENVHLAGRAAGDEQYIEQIADLGGGIVVLEGHGNNLPAGWMPEGWPPPTGLPYWYPTGHPLGPIAIQVRDFEWCELELGGAHSAACKAVYQTMQTLYGPMVIHAVSPHDPSKAKLRIFGIGGLFHDEIPDGALEGAVVLLSNCRSASNNSMHSVFTEKGASTVLGFTDITIISYMAAYENGLFGYLLQAYPGSAVAPEEPLIVGEAHAASMDDLNWENDNTWAASHPEDKVAQAVAAAKPNGPSEPQLEGSPDPGLSCCSRLPANLAGSATLSISGAAGYTGFGSSMSALGDIDVDGSADFVVGNSQAYGTGVAWVFSGAQLQGLTGSVSAEDSALASIQGASGDDAGWKVAGVGDTNLDGHDDLWIGAPGANSDAGAGWLVTGPLTGGLAVVTGSVVGAEAYDQAGYSISSALFPSGTDGSADANGDGYHDLLLGAYKANPSDGTMSNWSGAAYLFHGPLTGTWSADQAYASFWGEKSYGYLGFNVGMLGDMDGDGYAEVAVHEADYMGNAASVSVWEGPVAAGVHQIGGADGAMFASRGASDLVPGCAGDVDSDGYLDAFVGNSSSAQISIVLGGAIVAWPGNLSAADVLLSESSGSTAGDTVASAGDLDCDGHDDLLVGAPFSSQGVGYAGAAYLMMGPLQAGSYSLLSADSVITGSSFSDYMGAAVAGVGDVSGGGCADVAITSAYGSSTGYLQLFFPEAEL